jgi:hypothetical protein
MTLTNTPSAKVERVACPRFRLLVRVTFLILLVMILYLTVKPRPAIQEIQWMPKGSTVFFDLHDGWKNAVGYGALALAGFMGGLWGGEERCGSQGSGGWPKGSPYAELSSLWNCFSCSFPHDSVM